MSYDHVQNNGSILDVLVELGIWQILCEVCHQGNEIYSICYNIKISLYIYIYIIKKTYHYQSQHGSIKLYFLVVTSMVKVITIYR